MRRSVRRRAPGQHGVCPGAALLSELSVSLAAKAAHETDNFGQDLGIVKLVLAKLDAGQTDLGRLRRFPMGPPLQ